MKLINKYFDYTTHSKTKNSSNSLQNKISLKLINQMKIWLEGDIAKFCFINNNKILIQNLVNAKPCILMYKLPFKKIIRILKEKLSIKVCHTFIFSHVRIKVCFYFYKHASKMYLYL